MASDWADVKRVFEALSYTVKGMSPDGTELYFTISYDTWRRKDTFDLCQYLEKKNTGKATDISKRLNLQFETYRARYWAEKTAVPGKKREKVAGLPPRPVRPMSFYVITNGEWVAGSDPTKCIKEMADFTRGQGLPQGQVTVEFISFAQGGPATQKINALAQTDFGM